MTLVLLAISGLMLTFGAIYFAIWLALTMLRIMLIIFIGLLWLGLKLVLLFARDPAPEMVPESETVIDLETDEWTVIQEC